MQRLRGLLALNLTGTLGFTTSGTGKGYDKDPTMESVNTTQTACTGYYCTNKGLEEPILNQKASTGIVITGGKDASANALVSTADLVNGVTDGVGSGITAAYGGATGQGDGSVTKSMVTHDVTLGTMTFNQNARPQKESLANAKINGKGSLFNVGVTSNTMDFSNVTLVLTTAKGLNSKTELEITSVGNIIPNDGRGKAATHAMVNNERGRALGFGAQKSNETSLSLAGIIKTGPGDYSFNGEGTLKTTKDGTERTSKGEAKVTENEVGGAAGIGGAAAATFKDLSSPTTDMTLVGIIGGNLGVTGVAQANGKTEAKIKGKKETSLTEVGASTASLALPYIAAGATTGFDNTYAGSGAATLIIGGARSKGFGQKNKGLILNKDRANSRAGFGGVGVAGNVVKGGERDSVSFAGGAGSATGRTGLGSEGGFGSGLIDRTVVTAALIEPIPNFSFAKTGRAECTSPIPSPICVNYRIGRRLLLDHASSTYASSFVGI
ncbi:hypothetical protein A3770_14p72720 [Chloropicon primus]|uniref:Uncharacterized protein n=1 Tax=Chloropicon primus TaxID=1764295 RepID=A0A5B8MZC6_9CHLO|nr:hypothetical protein A3770_14p72720 [Chloropicon primus]|eukprot:QDZ24754.1 hypothetical protein A3770_14p72720 [Chloropicon primus]